MFIVGSFSHAVDDESDETSGTHCDDGLLVEQVDATVRRAMYMCSPEKVSSS